MSERNIFIPLAPQGGFYGDNFELRYALRSIAALWRGSTPKVYIFGSRPEWLNVNATVVNCGSQWDARKAAAFLAGANSFLWWMDDCFLLKRSTWEQFETPRAAGCLASRVAGLSSPSGWALSLAEIVGRLAVEGRSCLDFSTPHGPYVCTGTHMGEACLEWEEKSHNKFPVESWILNDGRPAQDASDIEMRGAPRGDIPPAPTTRLLVLTDRSLPPMRKWLENRFPRKSPWEK